MFIRSTPTLQTEISVFELKFLNGAIRPQWASSESTALRVLNLKISLIEKICRDYRRLLGQYFFFSKGQFGFPLQYASVFTVSVL